MLITALVVLVGEALTSPGAAALRVEDDDAERWFAAHRSAPLTRAAEGMSVAGNTYTTVGLSLVLLVVLWRWLRRRRAALFVAAALVGEVATYLVAVNIVQRPRPPVPRFDEGLDPFNSYPSGHVAASMATYGALAVLLWVLHRRHRWLTLLLFAPVLVMALARLYLGVHHPTDVVASVLYTAAWLNRCSAVLLRAHPEDDGDEVEPPVGIEPTT